MLFSRRYVATAAFLIMASCALNTALAVNLKTFLRAWSPNDRIDVGLPGLWASVTTPTDGAPPPLTLRQVLEQAERDLHTLQTRIPLPLKYSIFQGRSALREQLEQLTTGSEDAEEATAAACERLLCEPDKLWISRTGRYSDNNDDDDDLGQNNAAFHLLAATLWLLRGHADVAHEVLLGVTPRNLRQAEYAASHPGQTDWTERHPLTDAADALHAALHRLEGRAIGEGGHAGYVNAKYWLAGGPKMLETPAAVLRPVRQQLAALACSYCSPQWCSAFVVAPEPNGARHEILAGTGEENSTRTVRVPPGEWDGFAFCDLCEQWEAGSLTDEQQDQVALLQRAELALLLRFQLWECIQHFNTRT